MRRPAEKSGIFNSLSFPDCAQGEIIKLKRQTLQQTAPDTAFHIKHNGA
jgi:hypothetical protein